MDLLQGNTLLLMLTVECVKARRRCRAVSRSLLSADTWQAQLIDVNLSVTNAKRSVCSLPSLIAEQCYSLQAETDVTVHR